ncbi:MAG: O-antigen ligase family protein [Lachnospiraceae bacterium]|nr:O-antigen ligase family protein [Lachnospiraceae bacterium]
MHIKEHLINYINKLKNDSDLMFEHLIICLMYSYPMLFFFGLLIGQYYFAQDFPLLFVFIISSLYFIINLIKGKKFNLTIIDICCGLMIVFITLSTIFSQDIKQTIYGYIYEGEPFTHIMTYYMLVVIGLHLKKENKIRILKSFFILSLIEMAVALIQHTGVWIFECDERSKSMLQNGIAVGFTVNQNYFSYLMVIINAVIIGIFLISETKNKKKQAALYILTLISFFCLMITSSRSAWLGVAFTHAFLALICILKHKNGFKITIDKYIKEGLIILGMILVVTGMYVTHDSCLTSEISESKNDNKLIEENDNIDRFGSGRGHIWKMGIKTIPDHWLFGTGTDNYRHAFVGDSEFEAQPGLFIYNMAHCEPLHNLVTLGVFAFITYMTIVTTSLFKGLKKVISVKNALGFIILLAASSYFIQSFVSNSILSTATYFWIMLGLLNYNTDFKILAVLSKEKLEIVKKGQK